MRIVRGQIQVVAMAGTLTCRSATLTCRAGPARSRVHRVLRPQIGAISCADDSP